MCQKEAEKPSKEIPRSTPAVYNQGGPASDWSGYLSPINITTIITPAVMYSVEWRRFRDTTNWCRYTKQACTREISKSGTTSLCARNARDGLQSRDARVLRQIRPDMAGHLFFKEMAYAQIWQQKGTFV